MKKITLNATCIERLSDGFIVYFGKKFLPRIFNVQDAPTVIGFLERYWKGESIQSTPLRFDGLLLHIVTFGNTLRFRDEYHVTYLYHGTVFVNYL